MFLQFTYIQIHHKTHGPIQISLTVIILIQGIVIFALGSCQLSCISAADKLEDEPERRCRWKPRAADLRPLDLPMRSVAIAPDHAAWEQYETWL